MLLFSRRQTRLPGDAMHPLSRSTTDSRGGKKIQRKKDWSNDEALLTGMRYDTLNRVPYPTLRRGWNERELTSQILILK